MAEYPLTRPLHSDRHRDNGKASRDLIPQDLEQENSLLRVMLAELLLKNQNLRWKLQAALFDPGPPRPF